MKDEPITAYQLANLATLLQGQDRANHVAVYPMEIYLQQAREVIVEARKYRARKPATKKVRR